MSEVDRMHDGEIVDLFLKRDEEALRIVSEQYGKRLNRISFRITQDEQTAEECVNDTYMEAWNRIPPSEPRNYLLAFLSKIIRAKSLNRCIYEHRLKRHAYIEEFSTELEKCIPSKISVEDEIEGKEIAAAISRFLLMQSEEKRRVFVRRYFYLENTAEIASMFGFSDGKVRTMLSRTRQELKLFLEKEELL